MTYERHDRTLKSLFSHPIMVEHLIRGFMKGDWIEQLDFSTLEPYKSEYISGMLKKRQDDMVWRIRFQGDWVYLLLVLEFQSSVDRWMSIRLMSYVGLLFEDIIKSQQLGSEGHLPPVWSVVFYNGSQAWTAPEQSQSLLFSNVPLPLQVRFPQFQYDLLDVGHYPLTEAQRTDTKNLLLPLIELEQNAEDTQAVIDCVARLTHQLSGASFDSLRRAFVLYLSRSLELQKRCPDIQPETLDLEDFRTMLKDRLQAREDKLVRKGIEKGIQRGVWKMITNMLRQGFEDDAIYKVSGCSKKELDALKSGDVSFA